MYFSSAIAAAVPINEILSLSPLPIIRRVFAFRSRSFIFIEFTSLTLRPAAYISSRSAISLLTNNSLDAPDLGEAISLEISSLDRKRGNLTSFFMTERLGTGSTKESSSETNHL